MGYLGTKPNVATSLADNIVTADKISDGAVGTNDLSNGAVTAAKIASGAAVANIGYTPLNKAGDTLTGPLNVQRINQTASYSGSTSSSGALVFNLISLLGNNSQAIVTISCAENELNRGFAVYIISTSSASWMDSHYAAIRLIQRVDLNNSHGSPYLYLANYSGDIGNTYQTRNTTGISAADIYVKNGAGSSIGFYQISVQRFL